MLQDQEKRFYKVFECCAINIPSRLTPEMCSYCFHLNTSNLLAGRDLAPRASSETEKKSYNGQDLLHHHSANQKERFLLVSITQNKTMSSHKCLAVIGYKFAINIVILVRL